MTQESTREPIDPDLLLARTAVLETLTPKNHMRCHCRDEIAAGEWDNGHKVRAVFWALKARKISPTNQGDVTVSPGKVAA